MQSIKQQWSMTGARADENIQLYEKFDWNEYNIYLAGWRFGALTESLKLQ